MIEDLFTDLDYKKYCLENKINRLKGIDIDLQSYGEITEKKEKKWETINPSNDKPSPPELDDLIRLHYLIRRRKVRTILEFGIGKSTIVMLDAIKKNKSEYKQVVKDKLRVHNAFEVHSVENNASWLKFTHNLIQPNEIFTPHLCPLTMGTFNDRVCTYYENLPNIRPDFIYLDGPDQFSAGGSIRGLNTNHPDRMPMAADILTFEHFLEPGTMIVVDGRTANARFLKLNLQRNWLYSYVSDFDQHYFIMDEPPLGKWNKHALDFLNNK